MKIFTELNSAQTLEKVKKEHSRIIADGLIEGANVEPTLELQQSLEERLKREQVADKRLLSEYKAILVSLRIRSFSYFPEQKVYNFLKAHFVTAATYDAIGEVSLYSNLRHFLGRNDIMERDRMLQLVTQNIRQCTEVIGKKSINLSGTSMPPQFRNWIRDYVDTIGAGRKTLEGIRRYLSESENARGLNRVERSILQRALKFYELAKVPTKEIGSLGNKPLVLWGFSPSEVESIDEDLFDVEIPDPLLSQYETYSAFKSGKVVAAVENNSPSKQKRESSTRVPAPQSKSPQSALRQQQGRAQEARPAQSQNPLSRPPLSLKKQQEKRERPQVISQQKPKNLESPSNKARFAIKTIADIEQIDVDAFRSIAQSSVERDKKINDSLSRLKNDHPSLLEFWQKSPLYRLYLEIGRESMSGDKSVAEIAQDLKSQNKPYLSEEEFAAVAQMSSQM